MYKFNCLFISLILFYVLSTYAEVYVISIIDNSVGVETKDTGISNTASFFISEELQNDKGSHFPIKSLNIYLEGENISSPISIGSFNQDTIFFNATSNQYSVSYTIPDSTTSGTYYLSFKGTSFNDNTVSGTSQNFNVGEVVEINKYKFLSPPANAIWLTKSQNHTIVFTVPNTAGQANKFSVKLKKVDDKEVTFYPVFDTNNLEDSEPSISLLDEDGVLCHVKKARYLIWSPIPNVPTGRYQLELYGYKDSVLMTDDNSKGAAYSGESEIFSLVRGDEWGGVVENHSNRLINTSIISILLIVSFVISIIL